MFSVLFGGMPNDRIIVSARCRPGKLLSESPGEAEEEVNEVKPAGRHIGNVGGDNGDG